ncbi:hypothetical protein [Candidatus Electronema sp. JC]|uniref:hypothetical protein n=1 Tax=Candidatus Electronema sp. JC TaxID=3401570 RepID=UPI003B428A88
MGKLIFQEGRRYTFSDYFELSNPTEEIAEALGYSFATKALQLPTASSVERVHIAAMRQLLYDILPKIALTSEIAKRDFMIAPVLWEVIRHAQAKIFVEYPIAVDDKLSGSFDYLLCSRQQLVVIEAKKGDLERGFSQLAAELIALDRQETEQSGHCAEMAMLYGAVSMGELWRFAVLDRTQKHLCKDLHTYRVPEDIEDIFLILLGMLQAD